MWYNEVWDFGVAVEITRERSKEKKIYILRKKDLGHGKWILCAATTLFIHMFLMHLSKLIFVWQRKFQIHLICSYF